MRKIYLFLLLLFSFLGATQQLSAQCTTAITTFPWTESFNATTIPSCWANSYVTGTTNWTYVTANGNSTITPRTGARMAQFRASNYTSRTRLVTPKLDITGLSAPRLKFYYANVNWLGDIDQLRIYYRTSATGSWVQIGDNYTAERTSWTEVTLALPNPSNDYYIAFEGASGYGYGLNLDDVTVEQTPSCLPPTNLTAISPGPNSVLMNWTAATPTPAAGYEWAVTTSSASPASPVATGTVAGTSAVTGVLTANTQYYAWVRSICVVGTDLSTWAGPVAIRTQCTPVNIPYLQDFNSVTPPALPSCTSREDLNGGSTWATVTPGSTAWGFSGNALRYLYHLTLPGNDWFYTNGLNLTGGVTYALTFKYGTTDALYPERMKVAYGTAAMSTAMTLPLADYPNIIANSGAPFAKDAIINFTPPSTGVYYIGFHAYSAADQYQLFLDDIAVTLCPSPTDVSAIGISPTSAVVSFTSTASSKIIEYGPVGFTPGTGTTAGGGTVITSATSPVVISTGLTAATSYDVYVRANCGTSISSNVKTTFTTLCNATNITYMQDIESAVPALGMPTCTSMQDVNGNSGAFTSSIFGSSGGGRWETYTGTSNTTYVSASKSLVYRYDASSPTRAADDWFYLQGLNLTAGTSYRLKFYYKASNGPDYVERLEVKYGTLAYAPAQTNLLYTNNNINTSINSPFDSVIVDFSPASSGVYYIGLHAISAADQAFLYIDDISVKISPKVDVGVTAVTLPSFECPTSNVYIPVTIRNFNTTTLNFATYPITVATQITGAGTGTATTTINTGTLAAGATTTVYLNPAFNFATAGTYNLKTYTSSPDDPEVGNDTLRTSKYVNPLPVAAVITPSAPAICAGSVVQLNTQYPATPPSADVTATTGTISITVPDNNAAGLVNTLNVTTVPVGATITGIRVTVNLTHTYIGDMMVNLKAPNGKILNLFNRHGGSGDHLVNTVFTSAAGAPGIATGTPPYTGTFAPAAASGVGATNNLSNTTSFSDLYSLANGEWSLVFRDNAAGDVGVLTSWTITLTYSMLNPTVTWTPVTGLFTDAAATVPYTGGNALSVYAKPSATTTYTVTATGAGPCVRTSSVTVTVNSYSTISIGNIPDTVCISDQIVALPATPAGGTWTGVGVSGQSFVPSAAAVGTYTLTYTYTTTGGCTSTATKRIVVKDCPERYNLLRDDALVLWPNPNNGQFNVRINSVLYEKLQMRVYNNSGFLVKTQDLAGLVYGRVIPFDLTNLAGGIYIVQFYYPNGVRASDKTFKVIVGHP